MQKTEKNGSSVLFLFGLVGIVLVVAMSGLNQTPITPNEHLAIIGNNPIPPEEEGVREIHWVTNRAACEKMAKRFRQQGRDLKLKDVVGNPYGSGGFSLRYGCIFEGPDAQPGFFSRDSRYEGANEWNLP